MTGVIFSIIGLALGGLLKGATGAGAPIIAVLFDRLRASRSNS
jgi:hypothetical protein